MATTQQGYRISDANSIYDWSVWLVKRAVLVPVTLAAAGAAIYGLVSGQLIGAAIAAMVAALAFSELPRRPGAWRNDPPSEKQIAFARRLGIQVVKGMTKGELSDEISFVTGR